MYEFVFQKGIVFNYNIEPTKQKTLIIKIDSL